MAHARALVPTLFLAASTAIVIAGPARAQHDDHEAHEIEEVVVQATRSRRRVQDEAIRVEVLNREEIEEKLTCRTCARRARTRLSGPSAPQMAPGPWTPGLRSRASANAGVRVRFGP
jgi:hypothetical protein